MGRFAKNFLLVLVTAALASVFAVVGTLAMVEGCSQTRHRRVCNECKQHVVDLANMAINARVNGGAQPKVKRPAPAPAKPKKVDTK